MIDRAPFAACPKGWRGSAPRIRDADGEEHRTSRTSTSTSGCLYHRDVPTDLPPCGLYRTVKPIGGASAGRLVYFHNHGNPGPGLYFPESWAHNRANFSKNGMTVPDDFDPRALHALPAEGFYRVKAAFFCCDKQCRKFEPDALVQLGYNGAGKALVFFPEFTGGVITVPDRGTFVDEAALVNLVRLKLAERHDEITMPRGIVVH